VETQVFPFDLSGRIEDGCFDNQRPVEGVFALAPDFPESLLGGSTNLALVPSLNALLFLLHSFGFDSQVLAAEPNDYEQFRRGARVIVYAARRPGR